MKKFLMFLCAMALVFTVVGTASAVSITNGSFEGEGDIGSFVTLGLGDTSINGWTVTSGSVDWIGNYWAASEGERSLDMSGSVPGTITQIVLSTQVGQSYRVYFDMAGNPDGPPAVKTLQASVNPPLLVHNFTFDTTDKTLEAMGWETMMFDFTATMAFTMLSFGDLTGETFGSAFGAALDNVRIVASTPVPEPSTILLLGSGLLGLVGYSRKRFSKKS